MRLFLTEKLTIFIRTVTVIRRLRKLQKKLLWLTATRLKVGHSLNNFYGADFCSVFLFFRVAKTLSRVCLCRASVSRFYTFKQKNCYMSYFRPHQCGLFIVILSSTLSLKTVVFFHPLLFLRLLSPRLKYSRLALCMNALPYAPYFRQRFAPFFRHRRRSQGYLKSRHRFSPDTNYPCF